MSVGRVTVLLASTLLYTLLPLSSLEAAPRQAPPPAPPAPANGTPQGAPPPVDQAEGGGSSNAIRLGPATLSGSIWLDGTKVTGDTSERTNDAFRVRRARVGIAGNLTPRIGWNVSGELTAAPVLRNAFLLLRLANQLSVRVGQANPMTALERGSSPLSLELIDRSSATNELTGPSDVGLTVFNPQPYRGWLGYALNVTNGTGFNRPDNNDEKDVSGRVALSPPRLTGLLMVVSGTYGRQPLGVRTRASVGAEYRNAVWRVMAEGLRQSRDRLPSSDGYYVMAAYHHRPHKVTPNFSMLEIAARLSVLNDRATLAGLASDLENDDGGDSVSGLLVAPTRELQFGVNYYVNPNARLMTDVVIPIDARREPGPSVWIRLQLLF